MSFSSQPGLSQPGQAQPAAIVSGTTTTTGTIAWSDSADAWAVAAAGSAGSASIAWNDRADTWAVAAAGSETICTLVDIDLSDATNEGAFGWVVFPFGPVGTPPDNTDFSTQSTLRLFEDGIELGPAHSLHADIDSLGLGRFSHYSGTAGEEETVRLSSSDNTNPTTNGRTYSYCVPVSAAASIAWNDRADAWAIAAAGPSAVLIVKVAPFFTTDTITAVGFQMYHYVGAVLTADGAHRTTGIDAIPNITNGYCVGLSAETMTLNGDGSYYGTIVWDSGGGSPFYVGDEVYVNAAVVETSGAGSAEEIADAVWDEPIADHQGDGSTGEALNDAGATGNPWDAVIEGSYTAQDLLRILAAVAAGKTTILKLGSNSATVTFRDVTDTSDIVEAHMQKSNRITVTITP